MEKTQEPKVWFITGTSTGFGRQLTEHLLTQGHQVVATLRKPEALSDLAARFSSDQLLVVKLDVTKQEEIPVAFEEARKKFGRVDIVLNNAGKMINGELESTKYEDARDMFEVNFWGAAQVTREAVRFFREVNGTRGGRLLQVSSGLGVGSFACYGYYSATKFAIEGLTEALVDELDPAWNIKVTLIEPGPFRTELAGTNQNVAPPHPAYTNPELKGSKFREAFKAGLIYDGDPEKACIAFEKISTLENPPLRFPLHRLVLFISKMKGESLLENAEKYKSWSEDLYLK